MNNTIMREGLLLEGLSRNRQTELKRKLTVKAYDPTEDLMTTVKCFRMLPEGMLIPRAYGMDNFSIHEEEFPLYDDVVDLPPINLRQQQPQFVDNVMKEFEYTYDVLGVADTGKGKTVMGLEVARRLGLPTVIVVDQNRLKKQWIDRIKMFFGDIPVGQIQGKNIDYKGYNFTVAMAQTLFRRGYDQEYQDYFGTVILDECHTMGAPKFATILFLFKALYRLSVTATLRTDALQKVIELHVGKPAVVLKDKHKESVVRYIDNTSVYSWYANISAKDGRILNEIAEDTKRNHKIMDVVNWFYGKDRNTLVIGERILHLQHLRAMAILSGIPKEDTEQITGEEYRYGFVKDNEPKSRPAHLHKWKENGKMQYANYTPVRYGLQKYKVSAKMQEQKDLTKRQIYTTYQMFSKGIDAPHLDSGIDVSPRSKAVQTHGRILRSNVKGKKTPIWVTINDLNNYKLTYKFANRVGDYLKSNAKVYKWDIENGKVAEKDARTLIDKLEARRVHLKNREIRPNADGNWMLMT